MKIVVISDSHGNIANLKYVLGFAKKIKAEAIIHCGDWDNLKSVEEVLQSKIPVYAVLGNADVDLLIADRLRSTAKKFDKKFLKFEIGGKKTGVIHNFAVVRRPSAVDVIFCGHRHFRYEKIIDGVKIVSPGALHSVEPSFAVYDTDTNKVEFFDLNNE